MVCAVTPLVVIPRLAATSDTPSAPPTVMRAGSARAATRRGVSHGDDAHSVDSIVRIVGAKSTAREPATAHRDGRSEPTSAPVQHDGARQLRSDFPGFLALRLGGDKWSTPSQTRRSGVQPAGSPAGCAARCEYMNDLVRYLESPRTRAVPDHHQGTAQRDIPRFPFSSVISPSVGAANSAASGRSRHPLW